MGSSKTPQSAGKVAVECPHCGFRQWESPYGQSTFCRKCGEHFELGKPEIKPRDEGPALSLIERVGGLLGHKTTRQITCFKCGTRQTVSNSAHSSLCPSCSTYIDLNDFKIAADYSRLIETQGTVTIGPKGDITSVRVACRDAFIEGKVRGHLLATGTAVVRIKGKLHGSLEVENLVVDKRAEVDILRLTKAKSVEIQGRATGHFKVDGVLTVTKRGVLVGTVEAKGIVIEKGGVFRGNLVISQKEMAQAELIPEEPPEPENEPRPKPPRVLLG